MNIKVKGKLGLAFAQALENRYLEMIEITESKKMNKHEYSLWYHRDGGQQLLEDWGYE